MRSRPGLGSDGTSDSACILLRPSGQIVSGLAGVHHSILLLMSKWSGALVTEQQCQSVMQVTGL